ncbi:MAG: DUF4250 domain-containing protein [Candidatus Izemoplasmatales bacterium]|jgi:hypothetical protein|nr:DUF4250 domain-containing protein [Candidatus Izemoplasmatales bacterium]MDD4354513.1 DUF4250 domain-containing protein [Candidatus Izemoplasmatales bacterium]MDY0373452.1 DUF4250 domain-containing protein [Candidatus Izemoplasmatales bacterium]
MHPWLTMDPYILLSICNMKLRNFYPSLEALCEDLNIEEQVLRDKLADVGFQYESETNCFQSVK